MRQLFVGFFLGLLVMVACGEIGVFPYRYYTMELPSTECYEKGKLLGKEGHHGWKDLPLSSCQPDENGNKNKCTIAFTPDFYSAKGAFLKCEQDLHNCHKKCK